MKALFPLLFALALLCGGARLGVAEVHTFTLPYEGENHWLKRADYPPLLALIDAIKSEGKTTLYFSAPPPSRFHLHARVDVLRHILTTQLGHPIILQEIAAPNSTPNSIKVFLSQ